MRKIQIIMFVIFMSVSSASSRTVDCDGSPWDFFVCSEPAPGQYCVCYVWDYNNNGCADGVFCA